MENEHPVLEFLLDREDERTCGVMAAAGDVTIEVDELTVNFWQGGGEVEDEEEEEDDGT